MGGRGGALGGCSGGSRALQRGVVLGLLGGGAGDGTRPGRLHLLERHDALRPVCGPVVPGEADLGEQAVPLGEGEAERVLAVAGEGGALLAPCGVDLLPQALGGGAGGLRLAEQAHQVREVGLGLSDLVERALRGLHRLEVLPRGPVRLGLRERLLGLGDVDGELFALPRRVREGARHEGAQELREGGRVGGSLGLGVRDRARCPRQPLGAVGHRDAHGGLVLAVLARGGGEGLAEVAHALEVLSAEEGGREGVAQLLQGARARARREARVGEGRRQRVHLPSVHALPRVRDRLLPADQLGDDLL